MAQLNERPCPVSDTGHGRTGQVCDDPKRVRQPRALSLSANVPPLTPAMATWDTAAARNIGYQSYTWGVASRTMLSVHGAETCSVAACAEIVGSKWTVLLVHDLSEGPRRFTQLEHSCSGISPRTLAERLRWLESEGIVIRRSYAESPPRVEYELTEKGAALLPLVGEMRRFGHEWLGCGPHELYPPA
jgi:DNA-binding HxlR family transcriptional regulator